MIVNGSVASALRRHLLFCCLLFIFELSIIDNHLREVGYFVSSEISCHLLFVTYYGVCNSSVIISQSPFVIFLSVIVNYHHQYPFICLSSLHRYRLPVVSHRSSIVSHQSSVVRGQSSAVISQSSLASHNSSVINNQVSEICCQSMLSSLPDSSVVLVRL